MITIVKAEKSRLAIRGLRAGKNYLVERAGRGWWIQPAPLNSPSQPAATKPKADLADHFEALADAGFSFTPAVQPVVPPCRF